MTEPVAGFIQPEVTGELGLKGTALEGARIVVRFTTPLSVYFDILEGIDAVSLPRLRDALRAWADEALVEWNMLDRAGQPVPATADGFMALSLPVCIEVVRQWSQEVPGVELPLGSPSPAGGTRRARRARARR